MKTDCRMQRLYLDNRFGFEVIIVENLLLNKAVVLIDFLEECCCSFWCSSPGRIIQVDSMYPKFLPV